MMQWSSRMSGVFLLANEITRFLKNQKHINNKFIAFGVSPVSTEHIQF